MGSEDKLAQAQQAASVAPVLEEYSIQAIESVLNRMESEYASESIDAMKLAGMVGEMVSLRQLRRKITRDIQAGDKAREEIHDGP